MTANDAPNFLWGLAAAFVVVALAVGTSPFWARAWLGPVRDPRRRRNQILVAALVGFALALFSSVLFFKLHYEATH